jgi:hypothetical protein
VRITVRIPLRPSRAAHRSSRVIVRVLAAALLWPTLGGAQEAEPRQPGEVHEHVLVPAALLTPTKETSGTAWLPAATPMYGAHRPWRGWDLRLEGAAAVQFLAEPPGRHRTGSNGTREAASVNWGMAMARRNLGNGRFGIRTMVSAEPWTMSRCGSISFLATGEVCDGDTIHDRQQPHDLFMELAVDYERPLHGEWRWQIYGGLAGAPALGPPGYSHRASAKLNPIGPMTHHWLDSTHVAFGLVTVGVHNQRWKIEASGFNGREPDESRVDVDLGGFDSMAARLSFLPTQRLALQLSAARLREAWTDFPLPSQDPVTRITASAIYHVPLSAGGLWATTLAFGANHAREVLFHGVLDATTTAGLLESSLTLSDRHTFFGRAEVGGMPAHHLHAHEYSTSVFTIGKLQGGYVHSFGAWRGVVPGIGGTVAISVLPPALSPHYSGRVAPSIGIFFSLSGGRHEM